MKKVIAAFLAAVMTFSLAACAAPAAAPAAPAAPTAPAETSAAAPAEAPAEAPAAAWKPEKPITLICPFNAGSVGDTFSRPFAEIMSKIAGVNVVVENMGGGSGSVGTSYMLSQPADGYTFSYHSNTGALNTAAGTAPFTVDDVYPLVNICSDYHVLSVKADSKFETVEDLVNAEKENPGSIKFGGAQVMGNNHLFALNFFADFGIESGNYIPYDDGGSSVLGLLGDNVDCLFSTSSTIASQYEAGEIRVLAYTLPERIEERGDAPTFKELGAERLANYISFKGMFINPKCPQEVLDWYADVTAQVCQSDEWKAFLDKQKQIDTFMNAEEFGPFYRGYVESAADMFANANVQK